MANRKATERNQRKLITQGASLAVTLPIEFVRSLGWRAKQKVMVTRVAGGLLVRDWKKRK